MAEINVGTVTIVMPEGIDIDPRAGKLTDAEISKLPRARKGLGLACDQTAVELEKSGDLFAVPGVSPANLRVKGEQAERLDEVIEDTQIALGILKQANLLADADAFTDLRKVNNQVKAQADFDPSLKDRFVTLIGYFARKRTTKKDE